MTTTDTDLVGHRARHPLPVDLSSSGVDPRLQPFLTAVGATSAMAGAGLAIDSANPDYLRHKPGETTVVGYRVQTRNGPTTRAHVRWCNDPERAEQLHRRALTIRPRETMLGPGVVRLDANTVLYSFPVDANLPRLRWWVDPAKIKRSLEDLGRDRGGLSGRRTTIEILRYKPERRVVAGVDLVGVDGTVSPLLIRYGATAIGHRLAETARALRAGGVDCPVPIAVLDRGRVTVDPFLPGQTLAEAVRLGAVDHFRFGEALAGLHRVTPPAGLGCRLPSHESHRAASGLDSLLALRSGLGPLVESVRRTLARAMPPDPPSERLGLIHGDLHPRNVLVDDRPDGSGRLSFIDLDRAAIGPPAIDLGSLLAQGLAVEVRRPGWSPDALEQAELVVDRYRSISAGPPVDDRALGWHTAVALVDQALLTVRQLEPGSDTAAELILKSAIDLVECRPPSRGPS